MAIIFLTACTRGASDSSAESSLTVIAWEDVQSAHEAASSEQGISSMRLRRLEEIISVSYDWVESSSVSLVADDGKTSEEGESLPKKVEVLISIAAAHELLPEEEERFSSLVEAFFSDVELGTISISIE
jgi:hypothetical protein